MTNLRQETIKVIQAFGHAEREIVFIGSMGSGHRCTWVQFEKLTDIESDADYGRQNVASDLVIVFTDGSRLARFDYDGEESWKLIEPFRMPDQMHPIRKLVRSNSKERSSYAKTLAELNGE